MDYGQLPQLILRKDRNEQGANNESMIKPTDVENGKKVAVRSLSYTGKIKYNSPFDPNYCKFNGRNRAAEVCTTDCRFHTKSKQQRCIQKIYSRTCGCNYESNAIDEAAQQVGKMQYIVSIPH